MIPSESTYYFKTLTPTATATTTTTQVSLEDDLEETKNKDQELRDRHGFSYIILCTPLFYSKKLHYV